jgi:hypothetical protein
LQWNEAVQKRFQICFRQYRCGTGCRRKGRMLSLLVSDRATPILYLYFADENALTSSAPK